MDDACVVIYCTSLTAKLSYPPRQWIFSAMWTYWLLINVEPTTSHCLLQSVTTAPIDICSTYPHYLHCKYGGYQLPSSASPHGPYFGVCYEDLLGRDYRLTDPTDARTTFLEKTSSIFQWRQKKNKNMVNRHKIHFFKFLQQWLLYPTNCKLL